VQIDFYVNTPVNLKILTVNPYIYIYVTLQAMHYLINLKEERGGRAISEVLDQHSIDESVSFLF